MKISIYGLKRKWALLLANMTGKSNCQISNLFIYFFFWGWGGWGGVKVTHTEFKKICVAV